MTERNAKMTPESRGGPVEFVRGLFAKIKRITECLKAGAIAVSSNPHFSEIAGPLGHVLVEFNYLEVDMGRLLARVLKQDDYVAAVFAARLNFGAKLTLAHILIPAKVTFDTALMERAQKTVQEAKQINSLRNSYIHSEYYPFLDSDDKLPEILKTKLRELDRRFEADDTADRGTPDQFLDAVTKEDLNTLVDRINAAALEIRKVAELIADHEYA